MHPTAIDYVIFFLGSTVLLYILYYLFFRNFQYESFISYKNRKLYITTNDEHKQRVSEHMIRVVDSLERLVDFCQENNIPDKEKSNRLYDRWNKIEIHEILPTDNHVAYVVNKDRELRICLRKNYTKGEIEDLNTTLFVCIHELAHMLSESYGHDMEFRMHFLLLLRIATSLRIYTPENYTENPRMYCDTSIYTSPCDSSDCTDFSFHNVR